LTDADYVTEQKKNTISQDEADEITENRKKKIRNILLASLVHCLCNIGFIFAILYIPISSAYATLLLLTPLGLVLQKKLTLKYTSSEIWLIIFVLFGWGIMMLPWGKVELVGAILAVFTLILNYLFEVSYSTISNNIKLL
jgi:hypothetical protein